MLNSKDAKNAMRKVIKARSAMLLDESFFGDLAMNMKLVADPNCKAFWTDGVHIGVNPEYAAKCSFDEICARICEMVMHNAHGHPWRIEGLDPHDANVAADYALWAIMKTTKYPLPPNVYYDQQYNGLSLEAIYYRIHQTKPPQPEEPEPEAEPGESNDEDEGEQQGDDGDNGSENGPGDGDSDDEGSDDESDERGEPKDPGSDGEVRPVPQDADPAEIKAKWELAVIQAAQAAIAQGTLPAGMERLIEEIQDPPVDSKSALRKFIQQAAKNDYSYRRPNRRYVAQGYYLPSRMSEVLPPVAILWDTSGSRDDAKSRAECAAQVADIFNEARPQKLYVIYCDAAVQRVDVFEPDDEIIFRPKGGGGTDFRPAFEWIEKGEDVEMDNDPDLKPIDEPIACLIAITDMYGTFPEREPDYPVMWFQTSDVKAPFGESVEFQPK